MAAGEGSRLAPPLCVGGHLRPGVCKQTGFRFSGCDVHTLSVNLHAVCGSPSSQVTLNLQSPLPSPRPFSSLPGTPFPRAGFLAVQRADRRCLPVGLLGFFSPVSPWRPEAWGVQRGCLCHPVPCSACSSQSLRAQCRVARCPGGEGPEQALTWAKWPWAQGAGLCALFNVLSRQQRRTRKRLTFIWCGGEYFFLMFY